MPFETPPKGGTPTMRFKLEYGRTGLEVDLPAERIRGLVACGLRRSVAGAGRGRRESRVGTSIEIREVFVIS